MRPGETEQPLILVFYMVFTEIMIRLFRKKITERVDPCLCCRYNKHKDGDDCAKAI